MFPHRPAPRRVRVCHLGVSILLVGLLHADMAHAQRNVFGLGADLRLSGIVDPPADAKTLGAIKIRAGNMVRTFGVLRAQTSQAEGMSLFNRSELHPVQLLLRGDKHQLKIFQTAPPGSTVQMLGRYQRDDYLLASIELAGATPAKQ